MRRFTALTLILLAGCAGPAFTPLQAGLSEAELVQRWGPPTARHALASGTRLEWSLAPAGRENWMVDLDAQGRSTTWRQVLDRRHLEAVQGRLPGMSTAELRATLGTPSEVRGGGLRGGKVWSWRHESPFCLWFQASVGTDGRVTDASFAPDPACDAKDDYDR